MVWTRFENKNKDAHERFCSKSNKKYLKRMKVPIIREGPLEENYAKFFKGKKKQDSIAIKI